MVGGRKPGQANDYYLIIWHNSIRKKLCTWTSSTMQLISWRHVTRFESGCTCQLPKFLRWYIWGEWALKISNMWLNMEVVVIKELCKQSVPPYDIFWIVWTCLNMWFTPKKLQVEGISSSQWNSISWCSNLTTQSIRAALIIPTFLGRRRKKRTGQKTFCKHLTSFKAYWIEVQLKRACLQSFRDDNEKILDPQSTMLLLKFQIFP